MKNYLLLTLLIAMNLLLVFVCLSLQPFTPTETTFAFFILWLCSSFSIGLIVGEIKTEKHTHKN